ncbi:MAG: FAD-dependent monooxygenase, partial [archaeon]|nr:FAD-dependent monooxygenase [archaeon]
LVSALIDTRLRAAGEDSILFESQAIDIQPLPQDSSDSNTRSKVLISSKSSGPLEVHCDFVASCDGASGLLRSMVRSGKLPATIYSHKWPFSWMRLQAPIAPIHTETIYIHSPRGFALASPSRSFDATSPTESRYYLQVPTDDSTVAFWTAPRFWEEFALRAPPPLAAKIDVSVPALDISVFPLQFSVVEPLRIGNIFALGDAGHVMPPTGAKGLNLSAFDAFVLGHALGRWYRHSDPTLLDRYATIALHEAWQTVRFASWMTNMLHLTGVHPPAIELRLQIAELKQLRGSPALRKALQAQYSGATGAEWSSIAGLTGLPFRSLTFDMRHSAIQLLYTLQSDPALPRNDPSALLKAIDAYCWKHDWMMNLGDAKARLLTRCLIQKGPRNVIELGTYCGYSAILMASSLPDDVPVYSCEINPEIAEIARQIIGIAGLSHRITVVVMDSQDFLRQIPTIGGLPTFDFIFIDHWKDHYLRDLLLIESIPLLHPGSTVFADNVIYPGAPAYLEHVRSSPIWTSTFHEALAEYTVATPDGIEISTYVGEQAS